LDNLYFEIYTEHPFELEGEYISSIVKQEKLIFKGSSDKNGRAEVIIRVPTFTSQIYLCPFQSGLKQVYELEISKTPNTFIISPTLRGSLKSDETQTGENQFKQTTVEDYLTLGTWNSNGLPDYLESEGDYIPQDFLDDVNASLPEYNPLLSHILNILLMMQKQT